MEVIPNPRKYTSICRRKINLKISKLTDKKDFVNIFNIIQNEIGKELSINRNGIFFNINSLSDLTVEKIDKYLTENTDNNTITETESKIKYQSY
jgi:hypothetical protein